MDALPEGHVDCREGGRLATKVIDANVNWMRGWMNNAELRILVDAIPKNLVYTAKPVVKRGRTIGTIYYAESDGYVNFFYHDPSDERGFGSRTFEIDVRLENRSIEHRSIRGPWSSRSSVMNEDGFGPCMDVAITTDPSAFERGFTTIAGAVTLDVAIEAATKAGVIIEKRLNSSGETEYVVPKSLMPKEDE